MVSRWQCDTPPPCRLRSRSVPSMAVLTGQSWKSDAIVDGMRSPRSSDDTKDSIAAWRAARARAKSTGRNEALLDKIDEEHASTDGAWGRWCARVRAALQWGSLGPAAKVLTCFELPFTVARSLTVRYCACVAHVVGHLSARPVEHLTLLDFTRRSGLCRYHSQ